MQRSGGGLRDRSAVVGNNPSHLSFIPVDFDMGCIPSKKNIDSEPPMRSRTISAPIAVYKPGQSSTDHLFAPSSPVPPSPLPDDPSPTPHNRRQSDHGYGHHTAEAAAVGAAAVAAFGVAAYGFDANNSGGESGAGGGDAGGAGGDAGGDGGGGE
ncbi:hypothetical protein RhiJN_10194 [Ceratobasidium sp. AG-Ba]|nr:hypothetical protein RhiJN_10194 [Ceratobasidium sp. AG-Ba]QRW10947.1 hypothetical protein RhiLY_09946 [Ceratobasidium sp. AG-Ba]